jgi:hypothetical protein
MSPPSPIVKPEGAREAAGQGSSERASLGEIHRDATETRQRRDGDDVTT